MREAKGGCVSGCHAVMIGQCDLDGDVMRVDGLMRVVNLEVGCGSSVHYERRHVC